MSKNGHGKIPFAGVTDLRNIIINAPPVDILDEEIEEATKAVKGAKEVLATLEVKRRLISKGVNILPQEMSTPQFNKQLEGQRKLVAALIEIKKGLEKERESGDETETIGE